MFEKFCSEYFLREALVSGTDFAPLPKRGERDVWDCVDPEVCGFYLTEAEKITAGPIPQLTASDYLEYFENGNRTNFEDKFHGRRAALRNLLIAECCENQGRFYKAILDYTYSICDEFSWVVPAHNNQNMQEKLCLPDSVNPSFVDLFAAETAAVLTWTYYLFGDRFDETCPFVNERIRYEVTRRVLKPLSSGCIMSWMGYYGHKINNWVPWIVSNCIPAAAVFAEGYEKVILMQRLLVALDRFIGEYKPDGGCDEGPGYWNAAGAALFDGLQMLYAATNGKINLFGEILIRQIGEYILHAHLFDGTFINFADGAPVPSVSAGLIYRYGKLIRNESLMAFGAELFRKTAQPDDNRFFSYRTIQNALEFHEVKTYIGCYQPEAQTYLPHLEVSASRDTASGLFVACKGGHNDESHNHNDVGTFMIYKNKKPIVIDPGCEDYVEKTFSPERYTIWTMQSQYHNLPVINGFMQKEGARYHAENVHCHFEENGFDFSLDAEKAYPAEAGVAKYQRKISAVYGAEGHVTVRDRILLNTCGSVIMYLTFADKPQIADSALRLNDSEIAFDQEAWQVELEELVLRDEKMRSDWGRDSLWRAAFVPKKTGSAYTFAITVR